MDNQYQVEQWVEELDNNEMEEIIEVETVGVSEQPEPEEEYIITEIAHYPNSVDQIAAENLIYMAQDGQVRTLDDLIEESVEEVQENENENQLLECVTEEVITDDWVQQQGEERVEIAVDQIYGSLVSNSDFEDVPLPTDQDQYTALRPYPCDFCSRRFRKKVSLMNHMVAHQNDRPNVCNLCGARYARKTDLINHLKIHAHIPESMKNIEDNYFGDHMEYRARTNKINYFVKESLEKEKAKLKIRGKKPKVKDEIQFFDAEDFIEESVNEEVIKNPIIDLKKPFVCQHCGLAFAREKALSSHLKIHEGNSHECITCNEVFWDISSLNEHQKTHEFEASNSEYDPENDEESDSEDSKYGEYYCNICGMSFHRQDLLKRHTKTHVKQEIFDGESSTRHCCNVCGGTFAEALDLLAHAEVHARFQPFKCVLCGETFLEEATIKKHLSNVHSNEMTANSCKLCGKRCKDSKSLMKHSWDHSREKNHSCSKCGKNFHNKARLKRHMASHRNKSVTCEICNEEFPDGRSLMNHRHSHTNLSGRQFPCYECGKTFGSRSSQQIHVRIHTGERPYGCKYCWKAFADGGTLRKHERIHTGEKPYACSVCPRAFNQRVVLREHIRAHHSSIHPTRGTYFCTVCTATLASSSELIQHLIQHSDLNTAMQRQPITGPRKYKRRRKLKPHEIMKLRDDKSNNDDMGLSDFDISNVDDLLDLNNKTKKKSDYPSTSTQNVSNTSARNRKYSVEKSNNWPQKLLTSPSEDSYNAVFQNLENALRSIDSLVEDTSEHLPEITAPIKPIDDSYSNSNKIKTPTKRRGNKYEALEKSGPKMIHTRKTRVATEDGSKRKTRTLITRTNPAQVESVNQQNFTLKFYGNEFINEPGSEHQETNTSCVTIKQEQVSRSDLFDAQLLLEAATMRKDSDKFTPDIINDLEEILRSPIKRILNSPSEQSIQSPSKELIFDESTQTNSENSPEKLSIAKNTSSSPQKTSQVLQSKRRIILKPQDEDLRRSARLRRTVVPNKKYLDFNTLPKTVNVKQQTTKNKEEKQEFCKLNDIEIKIEQPDPEESEDENFKAPISQFQCEMCYATFSNREQLLLHVPIHI